MNNLKCRKQGFNKHVCKHTNKEIKLGDCKNCPYKEYKEIKCTMIMQKDNYKNKNAQRNSTYCAKMKNKSNSSNSTKLKTKTSKLAKLERERKSLFTDDLEHCIICGRSPVNKHEIFGGRNRINSIKYKLVIPLCTCKHHDQVNCRGIHFDKKLRDKWHKKGQAKFIETYPNLKFEDIFKENFL